MEKKQVKVIIECIMCGVKHEQIVLVLVDKDGKPVERMPVHVCPDCLI